MRISGSVLAVALVYIGTSLAMPDGGLWINDNGLKLIQVESIVRSGFQSFAIDWPGRSIDPGLAFTPITRGFFLLREGELFASYSPVFALVSAPASLLLGSRGLYLLPLLGAIAILPAVRRLALFAENGVATGEKVDGPSPAPSLAVLAAGLATPLWFYGATFWEHTLAVALSTFSLVAVLRFRAAPTVRAAVVAGVLLALPTYFRADAYLLSGIAGLVAIASTRNLRAIGCLCIASLLCLAPLWLFHAAIFGAPLGPHVESQAEAISFSAYLFERAAAIQNFLVNTHGNPWWSALAAAPFWLCVVLGGASSARALRLGVPLAAFGGLMAAAIVTSGHLTAPSPMRWLLVSSGLFAAFPLAILAFVRPARTDERSEGGQEEEAGAVGTAADVRRTLLLVCIAHAILLAALAPGINSTGVHWGNRFLLPLYPVLAVLACTSAVSWWRAISPSPLRRVGAVAVGALALSSVALQVYSITLLERRRSFSAALLAQVEAQVEGARADLVVTDTWFVPMDLAAIFLDTPIFYTDSARRPELLRRARRAGMRSVLLVDRLTPRTSSQLPPSAVRLPDSTRFSSVSLRTISLDPEDE